MTTRTLDRRWRFGPVPAAAALAAGGLLIGACDREPGIEVDQELGAEYEPEDPPLTGDMLVDDDPGVIPDPLEDPLAGRAIDQDALGQDDRATAREELGGGEVEVAIRPVQDGEVRVGETLEYAILVRNTSDHAVHGLTVHNYLPASFDFVESLPPRQGAGARSGRSMDGRADARPIEAGFGRSDEPQRGAAPQREDPQQDEARQQGESKDSQRRSGAGNAMPAGGEAHGSTQQVSWRIGRLEPGQTEEIVVRGLAGEEGAIDACVTVSYEPAVCAQFRAVKPDIVLERAFAIEGDEVYACDEIPIVYVVTNTGTGTTQPVTIEEELPEGLVLPDGQRSVSIRVDPLEPGKSAEERILVTAERGGEFTGRATASTTALEVQSGTDSIRILDPALEMRVDAPQQQYLGRVVTFGVELENTSDVPVIDTVVRWTRPENGMRFGVSSGAVEDRGDEFFVGTIDPGETRRFEISFEGTTAGTLEAAFMAEAFCVERTEQTVSTELVGIEAVRLEAIDLTDPVAVGEITTYEIRVKNQGTAESLNVQVSAELPEALEFVSGEGDSEVRSDGNALRFGPLPELAPGDIATWRIAARANDAGKVRFRVELKTDATPEAVFEVEPTTLY